jgi:hypothetical protein
MEAWTTGGTKDQCFTPVTEVEASQTTALGGRDQEWFETQIYKPNILVKSQIEEIYKLKTQWTIPQL